MTEALQPILFSYDRDQEDTWVDARPFRAHLLHLLATGLTEPVIARLVGISERAVEHLAHGRAGRPVRRVCSDTGRRLLRITTMEARAIRFRPVPARPSHHRLRTMVERGWTAQTLADDIGLSIRDVEQVLGRGAATCPQLAALKISAAYEKWESERELAGTYAAVA